MSLITLKLIGITIIFLSNLVGSYLPTLFKSSSWLSKADSLAGGVFIGASIVHLFPESSHVFEDAHVPLASFYFLGAFLLMAIFEVFTNPKLSLEEIPENNPESNQEIETEKKLSPKNIFLLTMLFVHSFFEAISIGVQQQESSFWALFFAIISHHPIVCFALGLSLLSDEISECYYYTIMIIYNIFTPIIAILFMIIGNISSSKFIATMNAISAGVFIYVGISELHELLHKKNSKSDKIWHSVFFFAGLLWMALVSIVVEHHHE